MYESPINIYCNYNIAEEAVEEMRKLMNAEEAHIMYKVNLVVDVDKDELLKALHYDREQWERGYQDGYKYRDAEIVQCKDCKHYINHDKRCGLLNHGVPNDFFCKWGTKEEEDE